MATKQEKREARQSHVKFKAKYAIRDAATRQFGAQQVGNFSVNVALFNTDKKVAQSIETIAAATHKVGPEDVLCYSFINKATQDRFAIDGETIRKRTASGKITPQYAKPTAEQIKTLTKAEILEAVDIYQLDASEFDADGTVEDLRKALAKALK